MSNAAIDAETGVFFMVIMFMVAKAVALEIVVLTAIKIVKEIACSASIIITATTIFDFTMIFKAAMGGLRAMVMAIWENIFDFWFAGRSISHPVYQF